MKNMTVYLTPSEFLKDITENFYGDLPHVQQAQPCGAHGMRNTWTGSGSCAECRAARLPFSYLGFREETSIRLHVCPTQSHVAASSQPTCRRFPIFR